MLLIVAYIMSYTPICLSQPGSQNCTPLQTYVVPLSFLTACTVQMKAFFKEATKYYLVFELVSGGELFDEIVTRTYYNEEDARCSLSVAPFLPHVPQ